MTTETRTPGQPWVLLQLKKVLVFPSVPRTATLGKSWEVFVGTFTFQSSFARIRSLPEASRKIPVRIQVPDKRQTPGKAGRPPHFTHATDNVKWHPAGREQPWSGTWTEMEIQEPPAVQDFPGCAIFGARPFCEQWDVLHSTLRSQTLAEQSKQQEPKKKWI